MKVFAKGIVTREDAELELVMKQAGTTTIKAITRDRVIASGT